MAVKTEYYLGRRYGRLVIDSLLTKQSGANTRTYALCLCDCGNSKELLLSYVKNGYVKSCGCSRIEYQKHLNDSGKVGSLCLAQFNHLKIQAVARKRAYDFTITQQYLWDLFLAQDGLCAYTKQPISLWQRANDTSATASLDRIDSTLGYIEGNVQWVHKHINVMKNTYSHEYFLELCKLVTDRREDGREYE